MTLLDGKRVAQEIYAELASDVRLLREQGIVPHIALLLVGDNTASLSYVRSKSRVCEQVGIRSTVVHLPEQVSHQQVVSVIESWNSDTSVHGILVQLPLPSHIDTEQVLLTIDPRKDVDGFHPMNVGRMVLGLPSFVPCTPAGIVELLRRYNIPVAGRHVVVVGRSNIVGKPVANLLSLKAPWANAIVTLCHSAAIDLQQYTTQADILICAIGRPHTITAQYVRDGAVVIDVGINRLDDPSQSRGYRIVGDVDFASVASKAFAITPVPGGIGPMTIAMLLRNTVHSATGEIWQRPLLQ